LELKGPGARTDKHLFAKVARAALGLGNLRDGGHLIIGIDDEDPKTLLPGLLAETRNPGVCLLMLASRFDPDPPPAWGN
jgi:hypothetical protein